MGTDDYRGVISFPEDLANVELDPADYWPTDTPPPAYRDEMDDFLKAFSPVIQALETAAFAIPEFGIFVSSGIGFLWGVVQPGALHKYQEPLDSVVRKIVESKLSSHDLNAARNALDQFNEYVKDAVEFAIPQDDDGIHHTEKLATQFSKYVEPGGLLSAAFYTTKDNMLPFNATDHKLLASLLQAILQAYKVQLMCWQAIAFRRRASNNVSGYNTAQLEVITLLARVPHLMKECQQAVEDKIHDLKDSRVNGVCRQNDHRDRSELTEHRANRPDPYYTAMWVHDPVSERNLLRAQLVPTSTGASIGDVFKLFGGLLAQADLRPDGSQDNKHFDEILDVAINRYKTALLPAHMDEPFVKLRDAIAKIVDAGNALAKRNQPAQLKDAPVFVTPEKYAFIPAKTLSRDNLHEGSLVSFRYALHSVEGVGQRGSELGTSPWSPLDNALRDGELRQIYVGDGCAATYTFREIYVRTSEEDETGDLISRIMGHGIMVWP
ncbi:hypothetical protein GE09DRAFT_1223235 [Coniochaeta sp. 2T2.1]|nr:hypothetical protein GE09DRAFT_1223235 [Coniochaeta sp. 2T2.1]